MRRATFLLAGLLAMSGTAHAQIRGFGDAGLEAFSAANSFKAVFGQSKAPLFGGGLEFDLPDRIFFSVGASRIHRTGHRVFVFQNQVFTLNEPAEVTMTPLEFTVGYRLRNSGLVPYLAGGAGWLTYEETSPHAVAGDAVSISHSTYHALGTEPTSVAAVYNEQDLGGFTTRVKVILGR